MGPEQSDRVARIYKAMEAKTTSELQEILSKHDTSQWVDEVFTIVQAILAQRGLAPQPEGFTFPGGTVGSPPPPQPMPAHSGSPPYHPVPMPSSPANSPEYVFALEKRIMYLEAQIPALSQSLDVAIARAKDATHRLPSTSLLSPSFLSRAFAVWGHFFVAQLLVSLPVYLVFYVILAAGR